MTWKYYNEDNTEIDTGSMVITYPTGVEYLDKRVEDYLAEGKTIKPYEARPALPDPNKKGKDLEARLAKLEDRLAKVEKK